MLVLEVSERGSGSPRRVSQQKDLEIKPGFMMKFPEKETRDPRNMVVANAISKGVPITKGWESFLEGA